MALNLSVPNPTEPELRPRITVVGCGGAGGNAVNNMIRANLEGVEFVVCNTDAQALSQSLASRRIQLGSAITRGLGAGSRPEVGRAAAEEAIEEILEQLGGSNMVFITAGMGGGTGTGAAPVLARAAREHGILTVGVVTKPFQFEGAHRMKLAEAGIQDLQQYVDTLIVIPNQNLFRIANERTTFADAFKMADEVLHSGVRGVTDLMIMPGLINLDFADIRAVMSEMGKAMMGAGDGTGDRRALDAAEAAISNPLLDDTSMKGARGVLINITGGMDMTLFEVDEAANRIRDEVDPDANIIFGSTFDPSMDGRMRVSVVATGIDVEAMAEPRRPQISLVMDRTKAPQQPVPFPGNQGAGMGAGHGGGMGGGMGAAMGGGMGSGMGSGPSAIPAHVIPNQQGGFNAGVPMMSHGSPQTGDLSAGHTQVYQTHGAAAVATALQEAAQVMARPVKYNEAPQRVPSQPMRPSASDGPFIAPRPMEPSAPAMPAAPQQPPLGAATGGVDPFAEAAMTNGGREARPTPAAAPRPSAPPPAEKPRTPSLFERVTGGRFSGRSQPEMRQEHTEPQLGSRPAHAPAAPVTPPSAPSVSMLQGGADRQHQQDELLDIPAFLRRQAN